MISETMLNIFAKFDGDIDGFSRGGTAVERTNFDERMWCQIDALIQEVAIVASGLASPAFTKSTEARLLAESSTPDVAERIRQLASGRRG